MSDLINKVKLAGRELGRSVVDLNPNITEEMKGKNIKPLYFGIKDTNQIPAAMIERLRSDKRFVWLTVDKASNRGRALDTDLINPVTYRVMTGSSSGGPINIIKGITDFAIGTDGGGSVLAPAMSCQLPSMIGAGVGTLVKNSKKSTDGQLFTGSVGVIGKSIHMIKTVMECLMDERFSNDAFRKIKIVIPKKGTVICPDGRDMHEKVMYYLSKIDGYTIEEVDMTGIENRKTGMAVIEESFEKENVDLIVTCEGPVDVYGYGETIPQFFGTPGMEITKNHGKFLIRSANMCQTTALTIPVETLASGLVVIGKKGIDSAIQAIKLAEKLEKVIEMPEVWKNYFIQESQFTGLELKEINAFHHKTREDAL
ncbi:MULTISPECIES: amidase family protein [Mesobacillus]|uniref:Amidase domain-containing protein n=1 Tax=Mesobacillus stamsii TaxID=225347 RepID=A0ABU0FZL2_9BACI|nr:MULTISPECIES: amidase family protein [Mesobacillus]MDQ0415275.1 hypothetical protein [Mesobacillus stamsii]